jgi:hypothetical protein
MTQNLDLTETDIAYSLNLMRKVIDRCKELYLL